jgi:hypothetical protein
MVKTFGIIGVSEGNGHPFSYGSIINGYSPEGLAASGWPGIYEYVRRRHASEFGLQGWTITHAWTQDSDVTRRLCAACRIPHGIGDYREFLGKVDAVIIARDDFENHFQMAQPFLEAGLHVFVDKPLSLEISELRAFKPYLEKGQLMSCSGMRYARELDEPRADLPAYGRLREVRDPFPRSHPGPVNGAARFRTDVEGGTCLSRGAPGGRGVDTDRCAGRMRADVSH